MEVKYLCNKSKKSASLQNTKILCDNYGNMTSKDQAIIESKLEVTVSDSDEVKPNIRRNLEFHILHSLVEEAHGIKLANKGNVGYYHL